MYVRPHHERPEGAREEVLQQLWSVRDNCTVIAWVVQEDTTELVHLCRIYLNLAHTLAQRYNYRRDKKKKASNQTGDEADITYLQGNSKK